AFMSEFQNEPIDHAAHLDCLDPVSIASRVNGFERAVSPPEVEKLTAFIDVGEYLLWWTVVGWAEDFTGHVVDYGVEPEQNQRFRLPAAGPARSSATTSSLARPVQIDSDFYVSMRMRQRPESRACCNGRRGRGAGSPCTETSRPLTRCWPCTSAPKSRPGWRP